MSRKIGIIGAGISGLLACKYTVQMGFTPIVFESKSNIGGVWSETLETTKLQSPKDWYQFSDFPWPPSVKETFPYHHQVVDYLQSYALHFNILPLIKFNSKVVGISHDVSAISHDVSGISHDDLFWGGTGEAFSNASNRKWSITVQNTQSASNQVYEVDFVILCIGKFSDLPHIPRFPENQGPQVFHGEVLHSMNYSAMDHHRANEFIKGKQVTVVGFQKSALDIASQVASTNGTNHPCNLLFKKAYWTVPEFLHKITFSNLNRFSELMVHKPHESFFGWLLALLLSPLLWIFEKTVETYLKYKHPLMKYKVIPNHGFLSQVSSCMLPVLPDKFYDKVKGGSIVLKKSESFSFCENGLTIDGQSDPISTDIVILATGYNSDEKLKNIFTSTYFQKCIIGSSLPFYRECIHPRIPQLAILGYAESPSTLFTTEMRTKWLAHFLAGKFKLPSIKEMEADVTEWEKCMQHYAGDSYRRTCTTVLLQIYCNDLLCRDMGLNPRRKSWFLPELFASYGPKDYTNIL